MARSQEIMARSQDYGAKPSGKYGAEPKEGIWREAKALWRVAKVVWPGSQGGGAWSGSVA